MEWRRLSEWAEITDPDIRLGVISGRRRQGKTYLLRALVEARGGFYFAASESTTAVSLREFAESLAEHIGAPAPPALNDWDHALRYMYEVIPDGLIVIDEFPYLVKASPALPSQLQRALDPGGWAHRGSTAQLLLCGSAMSVMGGLLAGNAPLRGRASLEMIIRPFDYRTAAGFWGITDPRLAVLVHAVVGGTPAYRRSFVQKDVPRSFDDFDDWVRRTALNPDMPISREARMLPTEEIAIREPGLYNAVLAAVAAGNTTRGAIAGHIGRKETELAHPLQVLADAGLIAREADPFHARRSAFRITEPLITFYEVVVRRHWSMIEEGYGDIVWRRAQDAFLAHVVGPHFEALCRRYARAHGLEFLGGLPAEVGAGVVSDPANRTQIEVDVVVLASGLPGERRKILSLGEAKWNRRMGVGHLERLRRARDLLTAKGYDTSDTVLACYSGGGFDDELHAAQEREPVHLADLEILYGIR
ncbi:MAG: ATP-binding protein [Streptosporangiales bacterium]|nr:ATP-binding protein [Streptosporangiales bacterium]